MSEKRSDQDGWLSSLQRQSWELELLISGFSIFLLLKIPAGLIQAIMYIDQNLHGTHFFALIAFLAILIVASYVLVFNMACHLLLRGFWVGVVGRERKRK